MTQVCRRPLLRRGPLSGHVYAVTRWRPSTAGGIEALEKHDVTADYVALCEADDQALRPAARALWEALGWDAETATVDLGNGQREAVFPRVIPLMERLGRAFEEVPF